MSDRLFPELPARDEMKEPALRWMHLQMQEHGHYHTDALKAHLAQVFGLTPPMLDLRLPESGRPAFSNYVDWVSANFTEMGIHTRIGKRKDKIYALTPAGLAKATRHLVGANAPNQPAALVAA